MQQFHLLITGLLIIVAVNYPIRLLALLVAENQEILQS